MHARGDYARQRRLCTERDILCFERDTCHAFRRGLEVDQCVSTDGKTNANRFLSLRSVDLHYFQAYRRQLWTPQIFPSERDRA